MFGFQQVQTKLMIQYPWKVWFAKQSRYYTYHLSLMTTII